MLVEMKITFILGLVLMINGLGVEANEVANEGKVDDIEEMTELLARAEMEIEEELRKEMENGATSKQYPRKKVTVVSRAMAARNAMFRKAKNLLNAKINNEQEVEERVRAGMQRRSSQPLSIGKRQRSNNIFPGGYVGRTDRVTLEDTACSNESPVCNETAIFRTIDGKCNSLRNPLWGSKTISMRRLLPAITNLYKVEQYFTEDLVGLPCTDDYRFARFCPGWKHKCNGEQRYFMSKYCRETCETCNGGNLTLDSVNHFGKQNHDCKCRANCVASALISLPGARMVSHDFCKDMTDDSDMKVTHMHTQWGQFLDHDITLTPEEAVHDCCTTANVTHLDTECYPMHVGKTDSFYFNETANLNISCLEFSRSVPFCEERLSGSQREQFNDITAFVDASNVYGSDEGTLESLRLNDGSGKLKLDGDNLLPRVDSSDETSHRFSGDVRAIEMPGLATMHTLFTREHNRIVDLLKVEYPDMDGEDLFQHARRLLIAEYQNIVYSEFLPVTLGTKMAKEYGLLPKKSSRYDDTVDPSIINSFATSAYRYGHSMIQGFIDFVTFDLSSKTTYSLRENYFNTERYDDENGVGMEHIIQGLVTQRSQKRDRHVSDDLTNHLFPGQGQNHGTDLIARNIQRSRDHGIPGYAAFYEKLMSGSDHMDCWNHRPRVISKKNWNLLKTIYQHPHHIDLFVGGLAEKPVRGAIVGPIFGKIIALQFKYLMDGDRFFFTHKNQNTKAKLPDSVIDSILDRKLSDIICENTNNIRLVPTSAFLIVSADNPYKNCDTEDIKQLNINGLLDTGNGLQAAQSQIGDAEDEYQEYYVDDGCHIEHGLIKDDVIGFYQSRSLPAGVRCCSIDGSTCVTPRRCDGEESMTFDEAANQCISMGRRLCTKDELLSEICCGTGGGCDHFKVWTSTPNIG